MICEGTLPGSLGVREMGRIKIKAHGACVIRIAGPPTPARFNRLDEAGASRAAGFLCSRDNGSKTLRACKVPRERGRV